MDKHHTLRKNYLNKSRSLEPTSLGTRAQIVQHLKKQYDLDVIANKHKLATLQNHIMKPSTSIESLEKRDTREAIPSPPRINPAPEENHHERLRKLAENHKSPILTQLESTLMK